MAKHGYILRYLLIIRHLQRCPCSSKLQILSYLKKESELYELKELHVTSRTLSRDFRDIRSTLGIGVEFCRKEKGFCIPDDEVSSPFFEQVLESFDILNSFGSEKGVPDYILPERRISKGTEHFASIRSAIKKGTRVQFEYKKYYPETTEVRIVEPYALKQSRGRWYLLGFETGKEESRAFGLDRILWLEVTTQKFAKRSDIDWGEKYEHNFAMFTSDEPPQQVLLSYDRRDGHYIESMPIHHSQELVRDDDRTLVKLFIKITPDFIMELLSRCWSLEVLEPESLRHQVRSIFKEALKRNS